MTAMGRGACFGAEKADTKKHRPPAPAQCRYLGGVVRFGKVVYQIIG